MSEDETTTEMLAETEAQATEYTPPEGWRVLAEGETISAGDQWVRPDDGRVFASIRTSGCVLKGTRYIRRIEPEPQPQPQPQPEPQPQPQPVQVREGRWRTRGGEVKNIKPCKNVLRGANYVWPWTDGFMTFQDNGLHQGSKESPSDLVQYLGPIEPEPDKVITPDDVASEALAGAINEWPSVQIVRREVEELQGELGRAQRRVVELETLVADLRIINEAQEKTVSAAGQRNTDLLKLLDNKKRRISELETLVVDLRVSNEATEKAVEAAGRENTDLQHRLDVVSAEWAEQAATINGLQQQLEAVKAELMRVSHDRYQLQIELDAAQQVPTSTEDRFEQGWDAGTARAVETIAEWLEPLRKGNTTLRAAVFYHLPHIMRSLTGLAEED